MRLSVLADWLGARSLALVPPGDTVLVAEVALEATERRCSVSGLSRGVVATCEENEGGRVTVRLQSGRTIEISPEDAWFVWVTAPPRGAALNRRAASPSRPR